MKILNSLKTLGLLLSFSFLVSCGGSAPMVKDVQVQSSQIDGDIWVELSADLSIGNLLLPNATIPIILPRDGREIGNISLVSAGGGSNLLSVNLNVSETAQLDLDEARLPNGSLVPLIADREVITVSLGKGAEVYISLSGSQAAIGVAVPIRSFDVIGAKVGTSSLMPIFNSNGVLGAAGLFTSRETGKNGIALIADVSSFIGNLIGTKTLDDHQNRMKQSQQADLDYSGTKPSRRVEKRINRELYKMHRRRKQLSID